MTCFYLPVLHNHLSPKDQKSPPLLLSDLQGPTESFMPVLSMWDRGIMIKL